jgi:hypothetical protein
MAKPFGFVAVGCRHVKMNAHAAGWSRASSKDKRAKPKKAWAAGAGDAPRRLLEVTDHGGRHQAAPLSSVDQLSVADLERHATSRAPVS